MLFQKAVQLRCMVPEKKSNQDHAALKGHKFVVDEDVRQVPVDEVLKLFVHARQVHFVVLGKPDEGEKQLVDTLLVRYLLLLHVVSENVHHLLFGSRRKEARSLAVRNDHVLVWFVLSDVYDCCSQLGVSIVRA